MKLLAVPYRLLFPSILLFCCIGIFSVNALQTDVMFIAMFGVIGYLLIRLGFEPAPLLLGFVLGKLMEENFRRALIISRGALTTFVERPVSAGLLLVGVLFLIVALFPAIHRGRDEVFVE